MATCSSILAWIISWTKEPGGLQPVRLQRVRPTCATEHACMPLQQMKCGLQPAWVRKGFLILLNTAQIFQQPFKYLLTCSFVAGSIWESYVIGTPQLNCLQEICLFYGWSKLSKRCLIYLVRGKRKKQFQEMKHLYYAWFSVLLWNKVIA